MRLRKMGWVILLVWSAAACGPREISEEAGVDPNLTFEVVKANPETHKGKKIVVGGEIIAVRNLKETTEIEVLEKPLASDRSPLRMDVSRGRFILIQPSFLDPTVFQAGRRITVVGKVTGGRAQKVGEAELTVPVLEEPKIHLWPAAREHAPSWRPDIDIGFGYHRWW